jgi:hypothetical protein
MEFRRKFGKKKQKHSQKGLLLALALAVVLYLWFNADALIKALF